MDIDKTGGVSYKSITELEYNRSKKDFKLAFATIRDLIGRRYVQIDAYPYCVRLRSYVEEQ